MRSIKTLTEASHRAEMEANRASQRLIAARRQAAESNLAIKQLIQTLAR